MGNALSLALPFLITAWFQSREATDAFFYALGAILFLNVMLSVAVEAATTPYVMTLLARNLGDAGKATRRIQFQGSIGCGVLVAVGIAVTVFVVLPSTSFTPAQLIEVRNTMLMLSPLPVLITWNAVLAGVCYAVNIFGTPTATVALRTIFAVVLGFVLRDSVGLAAIPLGLVVGELLRTMILQRAVKRSLPHSDSSVAAKGVSQKSFWRSAGPQVASMSLGSLSPMIDKTVAIAVGAGAVTTLELAQRLAYIPILLMLSGVTLVLGSRWAGRIAVDEWASVAVEYRRIVRMALWVGLLVMLFAVPLAFLARPAVEWMFSISDPTLLAWTFAAAAVGIPFALACQLPVRVLLAARETRIMPYLTVLVVIVNLGLDLILVRVLGLPGIALASTAVNVINFVAYAVVVHRLLARRTASPICAEPADVSRTSAPGRPS
jgi:putative peptidoglycan lipid II flippase